MSIPTTPQKPQHFDAIIMGIGHQGLIAANYLARAGFKVAVFDVPSAVDGGAAYDLFADSARSGPCAHTPVPVSQKVNEDLSLEDCGWTLRPENTCSFVPVGEQTNEYFFATSGQQATQREIAKFSKDDAQAFVRLFERLSNLGAIFDQVSDNLPKYDQKGWQDLWGVFETGKLLSKAGQDAQDLFASLMRKSLTEFLEETFESDAVRGYVGFQATLGGMSNPDRKGSAATLVQYILGLDRHRPLKGDWQPLRGSLHHYMKALTQGALNNNVTFIPGNYIEHIRVQQGKILSLKMEGGEQFTAGAYIADINPIFLFSDLVDQEQLPADFRLKIQNMRGSSGFVRVKMLVNDVPRFGGLSGFGDESFLAGETLICPSLDYLRNALGQARGSGGAQLPAVSIVIPTLDVPELAPEGKHIVSVVGQFFDPTLEDNEDNRNGVATSIARAIEQMAPGFTATIENIAVFMGENLDKTIGPLSRDSFHGNSPLNQVFASHFGHHALGAGIPLSNLTLCGYGPEASACAHTNNGGINAARKVTDYLHGGQKAGNA